MAGQQGLAGAQLIIQDGVVRFASQELEVGGRRADDLVGSRLESIEGLPADVVAACRALAEGGEAPVIHETSVPAGGDTSVPVEIRAARGVLDGKPAVVVAIRDISSRRQAEESLAESEERFLSLSAASLEGIAIHRHGEVVEVNNAFCEITGYAREQAIGMPILAFAAPASRQTILEMVAAGHDRPYEVMGLHREGHTRPIMLSGRNTTYGGEPARVTAFVDITEMKRAEAERLELQAQVQQAQRLDSLGVLAGGIAHDFNNLLMGILGNAALAREQLPSASGLRPLMDDVVAAAEHLAVLTEQLLAYSGKGRFVVEPVVLTDLVEQMSDLLRMSLTGRTVLRLDLEQNLPAIEADASQLRQVLVNLVTNAAESTSEAGGVVVVRTAAVDSEDYEHGSLLAGPSPPRGGCVLLEVSDTGSGMDRETSDRVFDPFFSTKFTGRGLGLAAVAGIVHGHGGAIGVSSTPGEGSTFRVLLPTTRTVRREPGDGDATAPLVLVIDDEDTVLRVVPRMLERDGYRALTAENGDAGLALLEQHAGEVAAVLLDATMPRKDGLDVLAEIEDRWPGTRVILCSGHSEEQATQKFAPGRLAGFLHKPFRRDRLVELLREVTGG